MRLYFYLYSYRHGNEAYAGVFVSYLITAGCASIGREVAVGVAGMAACCRGLACCPV